jgi:hypothetical protein
MIELPNGDVILRKGELMPCRCVCGHLYQPKANSECSDCPECGHLNLHAQQSWRLIEPPGRPRFDCDPG